MKAKIPTRAEYRERTDNAKIRLEYLRGELRAERISYGELLELQSLAKYIEPDDLELMIPLRKRRMAD